MNNEVNAEPRKQPLYREAFKSLSFITTWLNYKAFSSQRDALINDPSLVLTASPKTISTWKSPLSFAIQGLLMTALLIQLTVAALGLFFSRPKPYTERLKARLQEVGNREVGNRGQAFDSSILHGLFVRTPATH